MWCRGFAEIKTRYCLLMLSNVYDGKASFIPFNCLETNKKVV